MSTWMRGAPLAWIAVILTTVVACAPGATPAQPTAQPAPKVEQPAAKAAPPAEKVAGPAQPKVERLVFSMSPPGIEGNAAARDFSSPPSIQLRPMYEYLVGIDSKTGKFIPQLATEWNLEPDGQSFRFKLRQGVQFHDNWGTFTARDVVHSWWDIIQEDSIHGNSKMFKDSVQAIDVVSDHELVIRLAKKDADFMNSLSELVGGMEIKSKAHFDQAGKPTLQDKPTAGTGAYQYVERVQGAYIRFKRVPYQHWRGTPDFPELELRWQKEASTRVAALLASEVHMTTLPSDLQVQAVERGFKVAGGTQPGLRTWVNLLGVYYRERNTPGAYKYPDSPLMDVRVRQALSKAVNREELNKAFFKGKGELMVLNHFHPRREGWNPEWERQFPEEFGYDPAKARALLAEAGYGPGKPLTISQLLAPLVDVPEAPDLAEAIVGYWQAVGVDAKLETMDLTVLGEKRRNLEFANHAEIRATASHLLVGVRVYNSALHGQRGSAVENPEIDQLYRRVEAEMDEAKQDPIWRQIGDTAFPRHQDVPLFWLPAEATFNPRIVEEYSFPGNISGVWTHLENVKAAR